MSDLPPVTDVLDDSRAPETAASETSEDEAASDDAASGSSSSDSAATDDAATGDAASEGAEAGGASADLSGGGATSLAERPDASAESEPEAGADAGGDPGPPYLIVDLYSGDDGRLTGGRPNWSVLAQTSGYVGAILKAWDGVSFNDGGWFKRNWPALRDAGGDRYGKTWFRGAYLFLEFARDGAAQADAYLAAVDAAGGWDSGDILPIIDVEQGGEGRPAKDGHPAVPPHPNRSASKQQIIDCATACADRIREQTSRRVILYGRGAMRDLGIVDKMGCDLVWNPAYTAIMPMHGLEAWTLEDVVLWQYCGDGQAAIGTLPHNVPGFGACDISVFVKGAQKPNLQLVRDNLL